MEGRDKTFLKQKLPSFASDIKALIGGENNLPPVESWHPEREGEIDIRIAKDGAWFYQGEPMMRQSVVRLLSKILRKDADDYYLVSPVEKMKILVDDAPFIITMMDVEGDGTEQKIHFSTHVGDCLTLGESNPLRVAFNEKGEPSPYVLIRHKLEALISRRVYYQMVELMVSIDAPGSKEERYGLWSNNSFFPFN